MLKIIYLCIKSFFQENKNKKSESHCLLRAYITRLKIQIYRKEVT